MATATSTRSVETFALALPYTPGQVPVVKDIEPQIRAKLDGCKTLLRWAIVKVDKGAGMLQVEGAHLKAG